MSDTSAKLLQYVQSGYHIKRCTRSRTHRVIELEGSVFTIYRPSLKLTEREYEKSMRTLIAWLVDQQQRGEVVDICTSHYGHEWVELRNRNGKLKTKLALSVRAIHSLKFALLDAAEELSAQKAAVIQQDGEAGQEKEAVASGDDKPAGRFPRRLPKKPVLAVDAIPEQWR